MSLKTCPNCGVMLNISKKVCPKCNYNFKKSRIDEPKKNKPKESNFKINKPNINKPISIKHFDNGVVKFDYSDNYSKDFNLKYKEINVIASFKIGSHHKLNSAFAIFEGESIANKIPDSKFKEVIKKSINSDILDINRYFFQERERIIIETQNKTNGNIEYYCNVPEIGFSVLFVIPYGKEQLFNKNYISTVVNSLEKSTDKSIPEEIKTCPNCGSENPNESKFCMKCGINLDIVKNIKFCIYCGTEVVPGAQFCLNCGKLIDY